MTTEDDSALASLILENATDYAIFGIDVAGSIISWSKGAERIFGYSREEAIGADFGMLFTDVDRVAAIDKTEISTALAQGRAEDTRWHKRKSGDLFWANGVTTLVRGNTTTLFKIMRDETRMRLADEQRILLLNELNHRIKNTLATVQSIAEQTLSSAGVSADARRNFLERLIALSEAHNILVARNWAFADLEAVIVAALRPHQRDYPPRFQIAGPNIRLSPNQALEISLVLHELVTNALKYGALTNGSGQVSITWNLSQDGLGRRHMNLLWEERGGPTPTAPTRRGFGMRLLERALAQSPGSGVRLDFAPEGLRCIIHLLLSSADAAEVEREA